MTERLEVISGSMFAGKTRELMRLVERQKFAGVKTQIFKPAIDTRWGKAEQIRSHAGGEMEAVSVADSDELLRKVSSETKFVAIDEVQFFDEGIVYAIDHLLNHNIKILVAGLPLDFRGEPFGSMPVILSKADGITKVTAICTYSKNGEICGEEATRTQRLVNSEPANYHDPIVLIGANESYAPRCPDHHIVPGRPVKK